MRMIGPNHTNLQTSVRFECALNCNQSYRTNSLSHLITWSDPGEGQESPWLLSATAVN